MEEQFLQPRDRNLCPGGCGTSKAPLGLVSLDDHVKSLPALLCCAIHVRSWEFGNVLVCACGMMLVAPAPGLLDRMSQPPAPRPASDGFVSPFTRAAQEPAKRGASPEREGLNLHKSGVQEVDKQTLAARLSFLVAALGSQFQPGSLGLVQVGPFLAVTMPQWSSSASQRQQPRGRYVRTFPDSSGQHSTRDADNQPSVLQTFSCPSPRPLGAVPDVGLLLRRVKHTRRIARTLVGLPATPA